ncbi:transcriptional regulator, PadR-like family [Segniliparus rotundus DSM 44985]|uniref:Transcriptional regulator, PadR-like family n=1 Tax=Segniliparus rotundus (strain ATCC BAA-972 / CDC 1076 / CIP 108378 / DSM 44985 / JCM 13578) TaxID=640132 RepID=D6ZAK5_SEGRD|nr:PadR family transcriptional regulator [Segniliparus rotundus]ADG98741.1 transcriptional regulator, PadR-like family [Segniliparus rotundus DSM 44985]
MFRPLHVDLFDQIPAEAIRGAREAFASRFDFARPNFGFGPAGLGRPGKEALGQDGSRCGRGGPGDFGPGFGPGGFGPLDGPGWGGAPHGRGRGRGRGHRRRGHGPEGRNFDLRAAILTLLAEEPLHGYELMRRISERSGGQWRPSPGSIYPSLAKLRDEGLVLIEEEDGRKTAKLTEAGRSHVAEFAAELGEVWAGAEPAEDDPLVDFWAQVRQLMMAARQLVSIGDPEQLEKAAAVIVAARRKLYAVLAEDEDEPSPGRHEDGPSGPDPSGPAR